MAHITLIRPPAVMPRTSFQSQEGVPPLGVAYLAGSLRAAGHEVTIIDGLGLDLDSYTLIPGTNLLVQGLLAPDIVQQIPPETQIIGISCMFANEWINTRNVVAAIKLRFPEVLLVAGGEHISADPEYILTHYPQIDICGLGEGEETLLAIIANHEAGGPLESVPGIAYRHQGSVVTTPRRARIKAIDAIPWPSWDGIPLQEYFSRGLGNHITRKRAIPMLASRGCPYQCTFCSSPQMWTTRWISRDPDDLLDEIESYIDRYHIDHVQFYDLTAIINGKWILEFTAKLIRRNLGITWSLPSGTRTEALSTEVLESLKKSGCTVITLSPESGSEATLLRIKKKANVENMLRVMRECHRLDIINKVNILFGLPGQTFKECLQNLRFIARVALAGADDVACLTFVPYPGSELFRQLKQENRLPTRSPEEFELWLGNNINNDTKSLVSWSEHLSNRQLQAFVLGGMAFFYLISFTLRPHRVFTVAYRVCTRSPKTMLEIVLSSVWKNFVGRRKLDVKTLDRPAIDAVAP